METEKIFDEGIRNALRQLVKNAPCKTIEINGKPYLRRYYLGTLECGSQQWVHEFLTADGERHFHSHPWQAVSRVIVGCYVEQELIFVKDGHSKAYFTYLPGHTNIIYPDKLHRIHQIEPGTWTQLLIAKERLKTWFFIDETGKKTEVETSPTDWYMHEKPLEQTEGA